MRALIVNKIPRAAQCDIVRVNMYPDVGKTENVQNVMEIIRFSK